MKPAIHWFRQDLRLSDNPALLAAAGHPLICLYVLDDETPGKWAIGGAARWWLHHSLTALGRQLQDHGGRLILRRGKAEDILPALADESGAGLVTWNRCYEPFAAARDTAIKARLTHAGVTVESFNGAMLHEPWDIKTEAGKPFRVFTPFWNAMWRRDDLEKPSHTPHKMAFHAGIASGRLAAWALLPTKPNWASGFDWTPGEKAAHDALYDFLDYAAGYKQERDRPDQGGTSRLSPYLHWGEISPRQVWHAARARPQNDGIETFLKELGWREFCTQLLYHHPTLPADPLDERFKQFAWQRSDTDLRAWERGETGIPIVDAGMRQLWQTGWMHNRVRMIVASLLIKHLGIHWHKGQDWFWNTLVDADLGNNAANWQWVAGCGADAAPFFRIFNPVLQGEKFDPQGAYVRRFLPELADVPDRYVHKPWAAPHPPAHYPAPIVDLAQGRARALDAFQAIKRPA